MGKTLTCFLVCVCSAGPDVLGNKIPVFHQGIMEGSFTGQASVKLISHNERLWYVRPSHFAQRSFLTTKDYGKLVLPTFGRHTGVHWILWRSKGSDVHIANWYSTHCSRQCPSYSLLLFHWGSRNRCITHAWEGMVQARIAGQADEIPDLYQTRRQNAQTVVLWELDMGSSMTFEGGCSHTECTHRLDGRTHDLDRTVNEGMESLSGGSRGSKFVWALRSQQDSAGGFRRRAEKL